MRVPASQGDTATHLNIYTGLIKTKFSPPQQQVITKNFQHHLKFLFLIFGTNSGNFNIPPQFTCQAVTKFIWLMTRNGNAEHNKKK